MKSIVLHRIEMNVGKRSCVGGLDQGDVPISHMKEEIRKCLV